MLEENPALAIKNPVPRRPEIQPFGSWDEIFAFAIEFGEWAPVPIFAASTGLRPEEWVGLEWSDIDLDTRTLTVQRAYSKGRLTRWGKTAGSRRRVPLRKRAVEALELQRASTASTESPLVFPAKRGGYFDLDNWRDRDWKPALDAAGLPPHRIYDLRHTYATFSLAAGVSLFVLARRMGTSVDMIDKTYGHLAPDADAYEAELLDAWDARTSRMGAQWVGGITKGVTEMLRFAGKPSNGLEPLTPSLPWSSSGVTGPPRLDRVA
jgi:integrase